MGICNLHGNSGGGGEMTVTEAVFMETRQERTFTCDRDGYILAVTYSGAYAEARNRMYVNGVYVPKISSDDNMGSGGSVVKKGDIVRAVSTSWVFSLYLIG